METTKSTVVNKVQLDSDDFNSVNSREEYIKLCREKGFDIDKHLERFHYEAELLDLQAELVNLQNYVVKNNLRVAIIFEGRDASGKGGSIKRFMEHMNPRSARIVALPVPTEIEKGQWFFRRYIKQLPNPGEIVLFDRSWYNRAVVEPVMGFCNEEQYNRFMAQVPEFEHMLYEDGIIIIKFWFSISKEEQSKRFASRLKNPLKIWKFSPVDQKGQDLWDQYTHYKSTMFSRTHTPFSPWVIVKTNNKKVARLESIRYILSQFNYPEKDDAGVNVYPDPNVIARYYRNLSQIDN
ncbi:MAG: polyphosphate kinase 2 [Bacteroidia bacterium]